VPPNELSPTFGELHEVALDQSGPTLKTKVLGVLGCTADSGSVVIRTDSVDVGKGRDGRGCWELRPC